jgi:hypothetical protein
VTIKTLLPSFFTPVALTVGITAQFAYGIYLLLSLYTSKMVGPWWLSFAFGPQLAAGSVARSLLGDISIATWMLFPPIFIAAIPVSLCYGALCSIVSEIPAKLLRSDDRAK